MELREEREGEGVWSDGEREEGVRGRKRGGERRGGEEAEGDWGRKGREGARVGEAVRPSARARGPGGAAPGEEEKDGINVHIYIYLRVSRGGSILLPSFAVIVRNSP